MAVSPVPFGDEIQPRDSLQSELKAQGIDAVVVAGVADLDAVEPGELPVLALIDTTTMLTSELRECARRCSELRLSAIALVQHGRADELDPSLGIDDFVLLPPRPGELLARARRLLNRSGRLDGENVVRVGDLLIDPARYEVSVKGRRVNLRLKEYELLLHMASSPGRVFDRQTLLERIWGYAYLGGTRTVDVHIRRLRSKIEDADHQFIETVWNVGYRLRDPRRRS